MSTQAQPSSQQDIYFARVKPYNKQRGHVVRRIVCMGRLWTGGDGISPGDIPEWVKVNGAQADALKRFKQDDRSPWAASVFDIVTPLQRQEIDAREEEFRKAMYGLGPKPTIDALPDLSAKETDATGASAKAGRMTLEDLQNAPAPTLPVVGDDDLGGVAPAETIKPQVKARVSDVSGRMDATSEFPSTQDMNQEHAGEKEAAKEAEKVPAPVPTNVPPPKTSRAKSRRRKSS